MGSWREEPEGQGIAAHVTRVAEGLAKLLTEHLALARLELGEDAKRLARNAGFVAAFLPFVLLGYALVCVAVALWLTTWLVPAAAFGLVGGVNVAVGGTGVALALRKMRQRPMFDDSVSELKASATLLQKDSAPGEQVPRLEDRHGPS
jgi:uncharacterized membrane protein YqjE